MRLQVRRAFTIQNLLPLAFSMANTIAHDVHVRGRATASIPIVQSLCVASFVHAAKDCWQVCGAGEERRQRLPPEADEHARVRRARLPSKLLHRCAARERPAAEVGTWPVSDADLRNSVFTMHTCNACTP